MRLMCRDGDYVDGVHAIVAAEFAATLYSRAALPIYEAHFARSPVRTKEILTAAWKLTLSHAKTDTRMPGDPHLGIIE